MVPNSTAGTFARPVRIANAAPGPWDARQLPFNEASARVVVTGTHADPWDILAAMQAVPNDLYEAASLDGASRWQQFRKVTIPSLRLTQVDGNRVRAAIPAGMTARMFRGGTINVDGTIDNQIVAHEWGHYLSNRLVGNGSGLYTEHARGMGEGWSDWYALMFTMDAADSGAQSRGIGNYLFGYGASGGGIRMKLPETIRAAFVIARRDFSATVLSKTFLFFLLGPLFPIGLGFIFGGIGAQVEETAAPATVAVYRASLAQARGDVTDTVRHAERALVLAGPADHFIRGAAAGKRLVRRVGRPPLQRDDEPRYTQPGMYAVIDRKPTVRKVYVGKLLELGQITESQAEEIVQKRRAELASQRSLPCRTIDGSGHDRSSSRAPGSIASASTPRRAPRRLVALAGELRVAEPEDRVEDVGQQREADADHSGDDHLRPPP